MAGHCWSISFFYECWLCITRGRVLHQKSLINILAKNVVVFCIGTLAFWLLGFNVMFGDGVNLLNNQSYTCPLPNTNIQTHTGRWALGFELSFPTLVDPSVTGVQNSNKGSNPLGFPENGFSCLKQMWPNRSFAALFFFQLVFADTAATIVSGAVAERVKFNAFFIFSFVLILFIYPIVGQWAWGPFGWLYQLNFRDFAGSTVVHSVGGTAALMGAWLLGPRWTQFDYDPQKEIRQGNSTSVEYSAPEDHTNKLNIAHSPGFVTLGGFILWLGWIGFNGGSTTYLSYVPHIVVTTMIASAAGGITAIFIVQGLADQDPSLGTFINGILGGLVAITASSAYVRIEQALVIGCGSAIFVVVGEAFILPKLKIDDPVGAIPVHLGCGFWGTLAVGFFANPNSLPYGGIDGTNLPQRLQMISIQLLGWVVICGFTALASWLAWVAIGYGIFQFESFNTRRQILRQQGSNRLIPLRARHGIRLSIVDEYAGTYKLFKDSERDERKKTLTKRPMNVKVDRQDSEKG